MEDMNILASDCIVISCCCQCLILQIIFFLFLKLPYKLVQKSKQYAKKKLGHRRKREPTIIERRLTNRYGEEFGAVHGGSMRVVEEEFMTGCGFCMEEVEKVLEELFQKGEFAFGSFWGKEESGNLPTSVAKQEFDFNVVEYHLIEMVSSINYNASYKMSLNVEDHLIGDFDII